MEKDLNKISVPKSSCPSAANIIEKGNMAGSKSRLDLPPLSPAGLEESEVRETGVVNSTINSNCDSHLDTSWMIDDLMVKREMVYSTYRDFSLLVVTWNLNARPLNLEDVETCLGQLREPKLNCPSSDLLVFGFQEVDPIFSSSMGFTGGASSQQELRCLAALEQSSLFVGSGEDGSGVQATPVGRYTKLARSRLGATVLVVYVRTAVKGIVSLDSVRTAVLPTGIFNLGNKGAAAVRFRILDDDVCFVCVHLAAGVDNSVRRNQNFQDIFSLLRFDSRPMDQSNYMNWSSQLSSDKPCSIQSHEHIFVLGDFNYRIFRLDFPTVETSISENDFEYLLSFDELSIELMKERVFPGFQEATINFPPTFKFLLNSNQYDSSDRLRVPSYTDRILWSSKRVSYRLYNTEIACGLSDHKPVLGLFEFKAKQIDAASYRQTYEQVIKEIDGLQNALLPLASLDVHDLDFGELSIFELRQATLTVSNIGGASFLLDVRAGPDFLQTGALPQWLTLTKGGGAGGGGSSRVVEPGESVRLTFEVYINASFVRKFHSQEYRLDGEIVVISLQNCKDLFVTMHGRLRPTSFGLPLQVLLALHRPVLKVSEAVLLQSIRDYFEEKKAAKKIVDADCEHFLEMPFSIPIPIFRMVAHIFQHGLKQKELLRQPGIHFELQALRDSIDNDDAADALPNNISVHTVMETILTFLGGMMEPVIPKQFSSICLLEANSFNNCEKALKLMPSEHRYLFKYLMDLLKQIYVHREENGVDLNLLADLFGSVIFRDLANKNRQMHLIRLFLTHYIV